MPADTNGFSKLGPEADSGWTAAGRPAAARRRGRRISDGHRLRPGRKRGRRGRAEARLPDQGPASRAAADPHGGGGIAARELRARRLAQRGDDAALVAGTADTRPLREGRWHPRRADTEAQGRARPSSSSGTADDDERKPPRPRAGPSRPPPTPPPPPSVP